MSARTKSLDPKAEIMTVREVSTYLRVSVSTVYRLADRHELPAFKVSTEWRFRRASLQTWMLEKQKTSRVAIYPPSVKR